jgi:hypothetical protein
MSSIPDGVHLNILSKLNTLHIMQFKICFNKDIPYVVKRAAEAKSLEPDDGRTGPKHVALKHY